MQLFVCTGSRGEFPWSRSFVCGLEAETEFVRRARWRVCLRSQRFSNQHPWGASKTIEEETLKGGLNPAGGHRAGESHGGACVSRGSCVDHLFTNSVARCWGNSPLCS